MSTPLLWHSNAPWSPTGYGVQTDLFATRLAQDFDVAVSAFYGLEGNRLSYKDLPVYPCEGGTYGNESIEPHAKRHFHGDPKAGLVTTLMDVWVLNPKIWKELRVASWVPVDHEPAPPPVVRFFTETDAVPIAMSEFGERMLRAEELEPLYCPHAVDTSVYQPAPQSAARADAGLPKDAFVVGMVAANKGDRKCFPEALAAFKAFRDRHPGDVVLYLHTDLQWKEGVKIGGLLERLGYKEGYVYTTARERYLYDPLAPVLMARLYSALSVLLNPSSGEGFGVPILEAAACGTPAIVSDNTAMPEVAPEGASWRVGGQRYWTNRMLSWQMRPNIEELVEALEECYSRSAAAVREQRELARQHAMSYDVEHVYLAHMLPAIQAAAQRLGIPEREPEAVAA